MMNKFLFVFAFLIIAFLVGFAFLAPLTGAADEPQITYPIAELGNCASQAECKAYCDLPENIPACLDWAERNGVLPKEKVEEAKKKIEIANKIEVLEGPGGCKSVEECDAYCSVPDHIEECLKFSAEHGLISEEEFKKVEEQMNKGGPGGCKSKEECDAFCADPANEEVCMQFAIEEGFLTEEEVRFMQEIRMAKGEQGHGPGSEKGRPAGKPGDLDINREKLKEMMARDDFIGPGGCTNEEECKAYCDNPEHIDECMEFAVENGLIEKEKAEKIKELAKIEGPGGCKGKEECDAYCSEPEHMEECLNFAKEYGLIPPEEVEEAERMIKEMGSMGGPGGCRGPKECDEFCRKPENMDICIDFSVKSGMMSEEEANRIRQINKMMEERIKAKEGQMPEGMPQPSFEGIQFGPGRGGEMPPSGMPGFMFPSGEGKESGHPMFGPPEGGESGRFFEDMGPREGGKMFPQEMMPSGRMMPPQDSQRFPHKGFMPPEGMEGREGMHPEQFQGMPPQNYMGPPPEGERMMGPEGFMPPEGVMPSEGMPPYGEMMPPEGGKMPPANGMYGPEGMGEPSQGEMPPMEKINPGDFGPPPEGEEFTPPPEEAPVESPEPTEPTSFFRQSLLGTVLGPFLQIFR